MVLACIFIPVSTRIKFQLSKRVVMVTCVTRFLVQPWSLKHYTLSSVAPFTATHLAILVMWCTIGLALTVLHEYRPTTPQSSQYSKYCNIRRSIVCILIHVSTLLVIHIVCCTAAYSAWYVSYWTACFKKQLSWWKSMHACMHETIADCAVFVYINICPML